MALNERYVDVTTKYGKCPSFAVSPDDGKAYPGIIFYMDAPGYRTELENMARRIAKNGYYCLLPDMYYRIGTCRFDIPRRDEGMSEVIFAAMRHLNNQMVVEDTGGWIAWLDGQDQCLPGPIGVVGHCMSGQYVTAAAANFDPFARAPRRRTKSRGARRTSRRRRRRGGAVSGGWCCTGGAARSL